MPQAGRTQLLAAWDVWEQQSCSVFTGVGLGGRSCCRQELCGTYPWGSPSTASVPDCALLSVSYWKAVDSLKDKDCLPGALRLQKLFLMRPMLFFP